MPDGERRLAAIMFTDMVGYTALGQRNESLSLALVEEQRKLIRPILTRFSGKEIKTIGDAFLVEFPDVLDAARCAYEIQRATREYNIPRPTENRIHLRIGLHLGDVVESHNDISGDAVNVASRIEPLAEDGGVCVTRPIRDSTHNKLDIPLVSMGLKSLKNVLEPMEVYKMVMPWHDEQVVAEAPLDAKRVAVLPLVSMSPDPSDEYFADGMTEEIISTLSNIGNLAVVSRTTMMQYKGAKKSLKDIGKELGAGTMLEGSLRKAGNQIRITLQMLNTAEDKHLWAQSYDKELQNVFAIQSDIAKSVAESLKLKLLPRETRQIEKKPTGSIEAYTFYLRGRQLWNRRDVLSLVDAVECFKQAIQADPNFALGFSGLADCYLLLALGLWPERLVNYEAAKGYATKALELESDLAEAHTTMAEIMKAEFKIKESDAEFRKAIALKPSYATAHQWYGQLLDCQGRTEEALREVDNAVELDPLSPIIRIVRAELHGGATRDYPKLISDLKGIERMFPDYTSLHENLGWAYAKNSMFKEALEEFDKIPDNPQGLVDFRRAWIHAKAGEADEARKVLASGTFDQWKEYISPSSLGDVYLLMGDKDRAFELYAQAIEQRDSSMLYFASDSFYDGIRSDPKYLALLTKMDL